MSCVGFGATKEAVLITTAFPSERIGALTVYWNGKAITYGSGWGFDTQEYDDAICVLNIGTIAGEVTLQNAIYESATDDPTAATAISGADFTDRYSGNDECTERGFILCKDTLRYLFLKTTTIGTTGITPTIDFGASWIGGTARGQKTATNYTFSV